MTYLNFKFKNFLKFKTCFRSRYSADFYEQRISSINIVYKQIEINKK